MLPVLPEFGSLQSLQHLQFSINVIIALTEKRRGAVKFRKVRIFNNAVAKLETCCNLE